MNQPIYGTPHVAKLLDRRTNAITRLAARWGIGHKLGRDWFFTEDDIDELRRHTSRKGGPYRPKEEQR